VYFILDDRLVKIGRARNVKKRLDALQTSHSRELRLVGVIACENAVEVETAWHDTYRNQRVRGEWFRVDLLLQRAIRNLVPRVESTS
jgi:hypothetical protein